MRSFYACHLKWAIDRANGACADYRLFVCKKLQEFFKMFYEAWCVLNRSIKTGDYSDSWVGWGELS